MQTCCVGHTGPMLEMAWTTTAYSHIHMAHWAAAHCRMYKLTALVVACQTPLTFRVEHLGELNFSVVSPHTWIAALQIYMVEGGSDGLVGGQFNAFWHSLPHLSLIKEALNVIVFHPIPSLLLVVTSLTLSLKKTLTNATFLQENDETLHNIYIPHPLYLLARCKRIPQ